MPWGLSWWREILIGLLVVAIGVQSYRLQGVQGERDILVLEKADRIKRDAMREATNLRNKERTDAESAAARKRAAVVVVHAEPAKGIVSGSIPALGSDATAVCFDRGRLDQELAGWVERHATRLDRALAAIARSGDERFTGVAREGEDLASSYRGCRVFTVNRQ